MAGAKTLRELNDYQSHRPYQRRRLHRHRPIGIGNALLRMFQPWKPPTRSANRSDFRTSKETITPRQGLPKRSPDNGGGLPRIAWLCLVAVILLAACGGEVDSNGSAATSTSHSVTTTTLPPPTTTVPSSTTVPTTTTTTLPPRAERIATAVVERDTTWQDVFDTLTPSEQACIRDAVGAGLDRVLMQKILDEDEISQQELALLPCLPPQLIKAVFLTGMIVGMEDDGLEVGEEQEACLQEVVDEVDLAAVVSFITAEDGGLQADAENEAQLLQMMDDLLNCLPRLFDAGVDYADDFADGLEGAAWVWLGEVVEGVVDYEGDVDYFVFEAVRGELYEISVDLGTLSDSVVALFDAGWVELGWNDDREDGSLASRLWWRAPVSGDFYVEVSGYGGTGSYWMTVDYADDFADGLEGAAWVWLGEVVEGVVDYEGDVDYFVFEAVRGELYEISVDLGTLSDSVVALFDAGWVELGWNDDREDGSLASRLWWRAPVSGDFYVEVSGYGGTGSYWMTVDYADDFADGLEGAAWVWLGEVVEGVVDYEGDVDYFVFEAVRGELYEISVDLGTLSDSVVALFDAGWVELGWNDDREDGSLASRLWWRAPVSGDFYVEVSGYGGTGSYLLTVLVSE